MQDRVSRREFIRSVGITATAASLGGLGLLRPERAAAEGTQRPITDFTEAQGTSSVFYPPVGDYIAWFGALNRPPVLNALVDYAGVADRWLQTQGIFLGTATRGSVTERPLKDGRVEVSVELHTKNALTWVVPYGDDTTLLFGDRAPEVAAGATPALGESHSHFVFTNTAPGAPLPDLVRALFVGPPVERFELVLACFRSNATGPLKEAAGLGPDGTPGRCIVSQTGLFMTGFHGAVGDGFPAELVELRKIGG